MVFHIVRDNPNAEYLTDVFDQVIRWEAGSEGDGAASRCFYDAACRDLQEETDLQVVLVVPEDVVLSGGIYDELDAYLEARLAEKSFAADDQMTWKPRLFRAAKLSQALADTAQDACGAAPMAMAAREPSMKSLEGIEKRVTDTWQESLLRLIDEKGYTDTEVYKRANVDRKLFSKIRSNPTYQPRKITAIAFALALRLNLDETKDLLGRAGYAFSPSSISDLIIIYFIEHEVYDMYTINLALFQHEQPLLGE